MMYNFNLIVGGLFSICMFLANNPFNCEALIIPDEVPTLLSLIYSNIPTLKKGTDSRLGWGFRLGDRADFQFLVELGPQKDTLPLANQGENANKRQTLNSLANTLYAQSQHSKYNAEQPDSNSSAVKTSTIQQWNGHLKQPAASRPTEEPTKFTLGVGEVDAKDYIPGDEITNKGDPLAMLAAMYRRDKGTTQKPRTTTSYRDALDNVDLE